MITIEPMRLEDAQEVSVLEKASFSVPWSQKGFEDALHMENVCFLVAREEQKIIGYLGMYVSFEEGEITNVAVQEDHRGQGIGKRLLERLFKEAQKKQVEQILLEVRVSNEAAIHLYEKMGFVKIGVRKGFYELPREDADIMIKRLSHNEMT